MRPCEISQAFWILTWDTWIEEGIPHHTYDSVASSEPFHNTTTGIIRHYMYKSLSFRFNYSSDKFIRSLLLYYLLYGTQNRALCYSDPTQSMLILMYYYVSHPVSTLSNYPSLVHLYLSWLTVHTTKNGISYHSEKKESDRILCQWERRSTWGSTHKICFFFRTFPMFQEYFSHIRLRNVENYGSQRRKRRSKL